MLSVWLERWFTTCPPFLEEMGLLREMLGIRRRWEQHREAWEPHCRRSKQVVLDAATRCPQKKRAVLLGSGWLHDVPLAELAALFAEVTLVDLFHPRLTREAVKAFPNVRLVAADVTGSLEGVHHAARRRNAPLPCVVPDLLLGEEIDLLVSLNLLSQLPCMPEWYLRKARTHDEATIAAFGRRLAESHLAYLRKFSGVVALVSDVALEWVGPTEQVTPRGGTLYGAEMPYRGESWAWDLVPAAPGRRGERLRVVGVVDIRAIIPAP
jgi:hypothetical protein